MTSWQEARLIPVSGISNDTEAEQRATSALLAVLGMVRPFSKTTLGRFGASKAENARVEAFIETTFKLSSGKAVRPDGLVRVSYGKQPPWVALVEVKVGSSKLDADQVNSYLEVARAEGFDCVLTISNEISPSPGVHPTAGLNVRSNSKVKAYHVSWMRLLTDAVKEKTHRGVADSEQAWILGELIRYLEHPASGAIDFDDMGEDWVIVRDGAREGTLNQRDEAVTAIAQRWDQLLAYASLKLGADIGEDVLEVIPREHQKDPKARTSGFVKTLCEDGTLSGVLRVPNTIGDIVLTADLKARQSVVEVTFDAPDDKGAKARIGWLVRQLQDAPQGLVVEAYAKGSRQGVAAPIEAVREDSSTLIGPDKKDPAKFHLVARSDLGLNRRAGRKPGFVQSVIAAIEGFYGDVLQDLATYQPKAPKLPSRPEPAPEVQRKPLPSVPLVPGPTTADEASTTTAPSPAPLQPWTVNRPDLGGSQEVAARTTLPTVGLTS